MRREIPNNVKKKVEEWNKALDFKKYRPFRLDIYFKIGRNGNDVIAFDSILLHYVYLYILKEMAFLFSNDHDHSLKIDIPIAKVQFDDDYFYVCNYIPGVPEKATYWTKRFSKRLLESVDARRIIIQQGPYKSYKMPTLYDDRRHFVIFGTGDIDLIKQILPVEFHIGKKTGTGWGECNYKIKPQIAGNGLMHHDIIRRPLPVGFVEKVGWKIKEGQKVLRPISPPYFGPFVRLHECWDIGTKLEPKK